MNNTREWENERERKLQILNEKGDVGKKKVEILGLNRVVEKETNRKATESLPHWSKL
jgi:hypothetical protein